MDNRIVITGVGICCAVGNNVAEVMDSLRSARSGLKPYHCEKAPNLVSRFAGTIAHLPQRFDSALIERWDRGTLLAAHAASEALMAARFDLKQLPGARVGLATGASGSGQFHPSNHNPFEQPTIDAKTAKIVMQYNVPCFQTDELARTFGIHGPLITIASASAGSGIAIGIAMRWLQLGQADFVLAGGGEGLLPLNIIGFDSLGLLDAEPCSPFSRSQGMSMGEGAGFVTLERYDSAIARGAPILAQLHGLAVTSDAFDAIQFDPSGEGIRRALETALRDGGLAPSDIDWIRASGAGGSSQDASELAAIETAMGDHKPVVSSLESTMGHTNGAGPAMGLVSCIACQHADLLPATLNFVEEKSSHAYDFVPNQPRQQIIDNFLSTTAAFGGTNVVLTGGRLREPSPISNIIDSIVISGVGLVTPLGCGTREVAAKLLQQTCSWSDLSRLGETTGRIENAGMVNGFNARKLLSSLRLRGVDQLTQYAAAATKLALQDAQLNSTQLSEQIGIVSAISRPSGDSLSKLFEVLKDDWASLAVSKALLRKGRFLIASQLANWFSCKGFTATVTEGLGASLAALIAAGNQLRCSPDLQAVVVVAADEISATGLRMWDALGCIANERADTWTPYETRGGMIVGEGSVALILERAGDLQTRGGSPLATIAGQSQTYDAVDLSDIEGSVDWLHLEPTGKWLIECMEAALSNAGMEPNQIGLTIGNGCGVSLYDEREKRAWHRVFGQELKPNTVNSRVGVLESTCGLLGVAAAASHVQQPLSMRASSSLASPATLVEPTAAMVCASSETGRNSCVIIRSAS